MRYLLDTNVISEPLKSSPDRRVLRWLDAHPAAEYAISVVTLAELQKGVSLVASGRRRTALEKWLALELPRQFSGRVLGIDVDTALSWGRLSAKGHGAGRPLPVIDGLLLASAEARSLTLVTRNEADCAGRGVDVINPWAENAGD